MIHYIETPITQDTLKKLKAGDQVFISGTIYTARDQAHVRLINEENIMFPIMNSIIYYVGPTPKKEGFPIGSSGPTSSYRMDKLAAILMQRGVKVMIGKGDRSVDFRKAMIEAQSVYLIATGGAGALLSSKIKASKIVMYEDLGPEAIYELKVEKFPCFVAYDIYNQSIFSHLEQTQKNN